MSPKGPDCVFKIYFPTKRNQVLWGNGWFQFWNHLSQEELTPDSRNAGRKLLKITRIMPKGSIRSLPLASRLSASGGVRSQMQCLHKDPPDRPRPRGPAACQRHSISPEPRKVIPHRLLETPPTLLPLQHVCLLWPQVDAAPWRSFPTQSSPSFALGTPRVHMYFRICWLTETVHFLSFKRNRTPWGAWMPGQENSREEATTRRGEMSCFTVCLCPSRPRSQQSTDCLIHLRESQVISFFHQEYCHVFN